MPDFSTVWYVIGGDAVSSISAAGLSLVYSSRRERLLDQSLLLIMLAHLGLPNYVHLPGLI